MATLKINNKIYEVPQLGFGHMQQLESEGISVVDMIKKKQIFSMATAITMVCTGLPVENANALVEQHVLGGGDLSPMYEAFTNAVSESAFFKKLLGEEEEPKKKTRSTTAK